MSRIWTLFALSMWVFAGCAGSPDDPDGVTPVGTDSATTVGAEGDGSANTTAPQPDSSQGPGDGGELADVAGMTRITVTTPASGNGEFPLLAWESVEGVELYALTLTASDGQSYWAWSGPETEVYLGGLAEQPAPESSGPYLFEPMTLLVVGLGADGDVVASSEANVIAP